MNTRKNTHKTDCLTKIILSILFILALNSCKKNEDSDYLLQNEWKVKTIYIDNKSFNTPSKIKALRKDAYILKFINNAYFAMNTSVNYTDWEYHASEGHIFIRLQGSTRIANRIEEERNFDDQLLYTLNKVDRYYCKGNKLFFSADENIKIVFIKK